MRLQIDHHSGIPAYKQLMDQIRFQISGGLLQPGDEMPSTRSLSAELDLNPMTISKAYSLLQHDGTLEGRKGRPLRVSAIDPAALESSKADQLRHLLMPSVKAAKQLGISKTETARIVRELFDELP